MSLAAESELREIRGPSALGGGARRFFDLLWLTASTDFQLAYHGTVLGFLWSLVRPLLQFGILLVVFTQIFRFGDAIENYAGMLLLNVMLFGLFQEATTAAVQSVVDSEGLVRKMQFPRLVIPLSVVTTRTMQFGLNLIVVALIIIASGVQPVWTWILFPILVLALLVLTTALAMLLSALYVRLRDVAIIWTVLAMVLFYATPILYTVDFVPGALRSIIMLNPLTPIFEQAREWVIDPDAPGAVEAANGNPWLLIIPAGHLRRHLRPRGLGLQPRGAARRRGALTGRAEPPLDRAQGCGQAPARAPLDPVDLVALRVDLSLKLARVSLGLEPDRNHLVAQHPGLGLGSAGPLELGAILLPEKVQAALPLLRHANVGFDPRLRVSDQLKRVMMDDLEVGGGDLSAGSACL